MEIKKWRLKRAQNPVTSYTDQFAPFVQNTDLCVIALQFNDFQPSAGKNNNNPRIPD